jgi:hypothetical protein
MDSLLVGKSDSPCLKQDQITVFSVQRRSAACGKHSGDRERDSGPKRKVFAIAPERRSPSSRNHVRLQPGIAFGIARIPHASTRRTVSRGSFLSRHNHDKVAEAPTIVNKAG